MSILCPRIYQNLEDFWVWPLITDILYSDLVRLRIHLITCCRRMLHFVGIKTNQLISSPILGFPDTDRDYSVYTDASDVGLGAVLAQVDDSGEETVVSFASKAVSGAKTKWTTTEKEAFAVVWALQHFHPYVYGRKV